MPRVVRTATPCLLVVALLVLPGVARGATAPISARQHFVGVVDGRTRGATVTTVCAGPAATGRIASRQTLAVRRVRKGGGYTGPFTGVFAWFQPSSPGTTPVQLRLRSYGHARAIPTTVRVPCSGPGTVVFSSCPYLAPCAAGWVPDDVRVTFVDVGA